MYLNQPLHNTTQLAYLQHTLSCFISASQNIINQLRCRKYPLPRYSCISNIFPDYHSTTYLNQPHLDTTYHCHLSNLLSIQSIFALRLYHSHISIHYIFIFHFCHSTNISFTLHMFTLNSPFSTKLSPSTLS